jgi:hypothetical protein
VAHLGESSASIDASGVFPDGSKFQGADGLKQMLLQSDRFVPTVTEKLLTYALGRGLEHYDAPAVRAIVRNAAREDYRFSSIIARHRRECSVHDAKSRGIGHVHQQDRIATADVSCEGSAPRWPCRCSTP